VRRNVQLCSFKFALSLRFCLLSLSRPNPWVATSLTLNSYVLAVPPKHTSAPQPVPRAYPSSISAYTLPGIRFVIGPSGYY
jgi:hypothetical protein